MLDASATGRIAGPGGYDGGEPWHDGQGPGHGRAAESGTRACPTICAAGGGGGGHGGRGGRGGELGCKIQHAGYIELFPGSGGWPCGAPELTPLVGGSGGGGGTVVPNIMESSPGAGGGGVGSVGRAGPPSRNDGMAPGATGPGGGARGGAVTAASASWAERWGSPEALWQAVWGTGTVGVSCV